MATIGAACSGGTEAAATVNGASIGAEAVEALVYETGEDFGDAEFVQLLDIIVQWTAVADAAKAQFGIEPSDDEVAAEVDRIYSEQGAGQDFESFLAAQNISANGLDLYAAQLLIGERILEELDATLEEPTEAEAEQALADDPAAWTEVCSAHILVATAEEADDVLDRLDEGEDFAVVAGELSIDTGSGAAGGNLGCTTPSTYVAEFAEATLTAEVGQVVGPVESQFGFHLIRVDSRTQATVAELRAGLADAQLAEAVDEWYVTSIGSAEVEIAAEWGTWETDPFPQVVPAET